MRLLGYLTFRLPDPRVTQPLGYPKPGLLQKVVEGATCPHINQKLPHVTLAWLLRHASGHVIVNSCCRRRLKTSSEATMVATSPKNPSFAQYAFFGQDFEEKLAGI